MSASTGTPPIQYLDRYWHGLFYALVATSTLIALTDGARAAGRGGLAAAGLAAVYWLVIQRPGTPWDQPGPRTLAWFSVFAAAFAYLTGLSGAYFTLVWALYPQVFAFLGLRVGAFAAVPVTLLWTWRQGLLDDLRESPENLLVVFGSATIAVAMGAFIWSITRQSDERQRIIEQLEEARADLIEVAAVKGALEERERLAREIHDTLAQGLTGVVMQLEAAEQELDRSGGVGGHLDSARQIARDSLAAVRRSVSDLRPDLLDDGGLPQALRRTTGRVQTHWSLAADTVVTGPPTPLHPDAEVALLRVAQEALANVTKHAAAGRVRVTLSYLDEEVTLDVRDDGSGFDPARARVRASAATSGQQGGFGLTTMAERVETLGGVFSVESEPGGGTAVTARLPLSARQATA